MRYTLILPNPTSNIICSDYTASKAQIIARSNRTYSVGNICPNPKFSRPIAIVFEDGDRHEYEGPHSYLERGNATFCNIGAAGWEQERRNAARAAWRDMDAGKPLDAGMHGARKDSLFANAYNSAAKWAKFDFDQSERPYGL